MTTTDQLLDTDYNTQMVPWGSIYSDDNFNCRGIIAPIDVADLCTDIQRNKLQFPISLQPAEDVVDGLPEGKTHRIIAGHRRFKAWSVLRAGWKKGDLAAGDVPWDDAQGNPFDFIPAMIKTGLSETQARIINLGENLKRRDLNILQEAKAIENLRAAGIPRDHVASELGMSSGWVQTRYYLLDLPDDIQQECAAGLINQAQIKQLYTLRNDQEKQYAAVRKIKSAKANGEKLGHVGEKKKEKTDVKKERKRADMFQMLEVLAKATGYGLHTRALAWAAGQISTEELFVDVRKWAEDHNKPMPRLPTEF